MIEMPRSSNETLTVDKQAPMNDARNTNIPSPDCESGDARPAKAAVRVVTAPIHSLAPWLANAATAALRLLPQRAVALASIAGGNTDKAGWSPIAMGVGGTSDGAFARQLERTARLSAKLGNREGPFVLQDTTELPMLEFHDATDDAAASMCAYLGARRSLDLHAMVRVTVRIPSEPPHLLLVIQADALSQDWSPSPEQGEELSQFAEALALGYAVRFVRPERLQISLLSKLSQTQRRIVPLLMEEKSERDIATAIQRSRHTVHEHVKAIYQAWDVHSRHQARELWLGRVTNC